MLATTATETNIEYIFTVTDGTTENTFEYRFGKDQELTVSKREAELLAQHEINKKAEPTPVQL